MPLREKYPQARQNRKFYQNYVVNLTANRGAISDSIASSRAINDSLDAQGADGEYYTQYKEKRDIWLDICEQTTKEFDTFLINLDVCIKKARNFETLWANRIGVMEWYDG